MGKGSDRRPQLVSDETFSENWNIAFGKKRFMCPLCGWTGDDPLIVGIDYPFANVCPDCGCAIEINYFDDDISDVQTYKKARSTGQLRKTRNHLLWPCVEYEEIKQKEIEFECLMKNTTYGQVRQFRYECAKLLGPVKELMIKLLDKITAIIERIRRKE